MATPEPPSPREAAGEARRLNVRVWLDRYPDWTLRQFAKAWDCDPTTVLNYFHEAGIVRVGGYWKAT